MHRRRTAALLVALVAAVPMLSSCSATGRDAATNRVNQIVMGADNRDAEVDVLNAAIVANADGSGTFIATFVNNSVEGDNTVTGLSSPSGLDVSDFSDISVPPGGLVSLADDGGIVVSGDFALGQYVDVDVDLGDGSTVPLNVPVVADSGYWSGLDKS
jgi:hypothetical protein